MIKKCETIASWLFAHFCDHSERVYQSRLGCPWVLHEQLSEHLEKMIIDAEIRKSVSNETRDFLKVELAPLDISKSSFLQISSIL